MNTIIVGSPSEKHRQQMEKLGDFLNLMSIEYTDHGNRETYLLVREDGKALEIRACGNQYDGGFLAVGRQQ